MSISASELILNPDGSIYHLNLKPQDIADTIILVGDPDRVALVSQHFDTVRFSTQKREFKTHTGTYKHTPITVISTGIGTDNIDIVLNELDALVNIDFKHKTVKKTLKQLQFIRIGTSGALQKDIPLDAFLMSTYGIALSGMLESYTTVDAIANTALEKAFVAHTKWPSHRTRPLFIEGDSTLISKFESSKAYKGLTVTANGFYGPQGRRLRLPLQDPELSAAMATFNHEGHSITNLEMETSGIYGLAKLLGHKAVSLNAILANRAHGTFSKHPKQTIERLITYTLERI